MTNTQNNLIKATTDQIIKDLDELRNPTVFTTLNTQDLYTRIYKNLGKIQGLVTP